MRAEDGVAHKTLLLLLVRLIHADPMLLLNVKINSDHVYAGDVSLIEIIPPFFQFRQALGFT